MHILQVIYDCIDRKWEILLTRMRIGHSRLTHGYLIAGGSPPTCPHCGEDQPLTIKHVLVQCPEHVHQRRRLFGTPSITLRTMLSEKNTSPGGVVEKYVKEIGIFDLL